MLPTGTVTFLFTDIEGSTKLAQEYPDQWESLRARHHEILQSAIDAHNGYVFQIIGDAFCAAFHTASDALNAAIGAQRKLQTENWDPAPIKVRVGINTGAAQAGSVGDISGGYTGYAVLVKVQRVMSAGCGGQVLLTQTSYELMRDKLPDDVSLLDLGEHRLKDLIRPEHIYQLNAPGLIADFPPIKTLNKYRHNLPAQTTNFIGREKEITEIKKAISEHRLITLTGPGGTGKTRLSLQVAADLFDLFPNGIWFVELASITDPELIPRAILSAADIQIQPGRSALDSLMDFLREKTSLLILDNCEHLIEACAKLTDTLLATAPNLKIVASSREALGVKGEQSWRVPSLTLPDLKHLPAFEQLTRYEAVCLFIDRALLVQPHFTLTHENVSAIVQICFRLDGIPLAIELAAVRIRMMSAEQISTRLDDRFRLLTGGSRTALPRQQTLRATIDWSYDLLSENEKLLLRRLAVFMGGWTLEAAEQVCNDGQIQMEEVMDLLAHLVDKSLVALEEQPDHSRYRILETVRQYAREKLLESGKGEKVRERHFEYFSGLAVEGEPHLHYGRQQILWLDRLEEELDNFHVALEWSINNRPESGAELVTKLWWFWEVRGHWQEGFEWSQRALENLPGATSLRAKLLAEAGWLASQLRYIQHAIAYSTDSVTLYRSLGDHAGSAMPLLTLGDEAREQIDDVRAKEFYAESFSLFMEVNDQWGLKQVMLNGWAVFAQVEQNYAELERIGREALDISRTLEDTEGICYSLHWLAKQAIFVQDYDRAKSYYAEALPLARKAKYADMFTRLLRHMGQSASRAHDYRQAKNFFEEFLEINRELGNKNNTGLALRLLGQVARKQGDYQEALHLYLESIKVVRESEEKRQVFSALLELAFLNGVSGQFVRSTKLFGAVETLFPIVYKVTQGWLPEDHDECQKIKTACVSNLGKESFDAAYADGCTMTIEQAVAYALEEKP